MFMFKQFILLGIIIVGFKIHVLLSIKTNDVLKIDVCDDIKLSFNLLFKDLSRFPDGWTYIVGSSGGGHISSRHPDVYLGKGKPDRAGGEPFLYIPIYTNNRQPLKDQSSIDISGLQNGVTYNVVINISQTTLCVTMNDIDKGCVDLPYGHKNARMVTYKSNAELNYASIDSIVVESCVEEVATLDICDFISFAFDLNIGSYPINTWSFIAGNIYSYDSIAVPQRVSVYVYNNGFPYLAFRLGSDSDQTALNIAPLLTNDKYSVRVDITSTSICAYVTPSHGNILSQCKTFNNHFTGTDVVFRKGIGYPDLFQVGSVAVVSICDNCINSAAHTTPQNNLIKNILNDYQYLVLFGLIFIIGLLLINTCLGCISCKRSKYSHKMNYNRIISHETEATNQTDALPLQNI